MGAKVTMMDLEWRLEALQADYLEFAEVYSRAVKEFFGGRLVSICFFGSVVKGTATAESDLDALIVAEQLPRDIGLRIRDTRPIHETVRRSQAYRALRSKGRSAFVSGIFLTPDEAKAHPPIMLDMTEDAASAYDKNGFLEGVLEDIRQRLKELGARKVPAKKGYHWLLRPDAKPGEVVEI